MIMEVSLVENMPSVSLCKKLLNHLHFICLARGLDVTRPVIITNALTSINNHIIIEHNNYYLSFLQDMFPYFEKYGLINVLPDIISRIELLMNEKESTINELDKALLLDYKVWLLLSKKEYDNAIKKYNKAIRLVENYHNLNEISARSANLLSNIYNNLDYTTGMFYQGIIFLNKKDYKNFELVEKAINAVERGLDIRSQDKVDAMAAAIEEAIANLELNKGQEQGTTKPENGTSGNVNTGDSTNMLAWGVLLAASLGLAGFILVKKAKARE